MRFLEFRLIEGYKEVTQKFAQEADPETVSKAVAVYKDLVNRNQVQGNERNIDWWGKQGWTQFQKFVNAKRQQSSQTQQKKRKNTGNSYTLAENDTWLIVVPLDKDASCFHGKGTDWCTTKPDHDHFNQYFLDDSVTLIYFLQKQTGAKWAAAVSPDGSVAGFDKNDKFISQELLSSQTGIKPQTLQKYFDMVSTPSTDIGKNISKSRITAQDQRDKLEQLVDEFEIGPSGIRNLEIENLMVKYYDIEVAFRYFEHLLRKPIELDNRTQKLFVKLWQDDQEEVPDDETMISNVTNLSDKIKLEILRATEMPVSDLFGDNISNELQEKILDTNVIRYIDQTDIPLEDRHIAILTKVILNVRRFAGVNTARLIEELVTRADHNKIGNILQNTTESVLKIYMDPSQDVGAISMGLSRLTENFYYILDMLEKIAKRINYDADPILDWAVETYGIDYF